MSTEGANNHFVIKEDKLKSSYNLSYEAVAPSAPHSDPIVVLYLPGYELLCKKMLFSFCIKLNLDKFS